MSADLDLDAVLAFTIKLAQEAGEMIRQGQAKRFASGAQNDQKMNSVDLVTEVDQAVEAFITEKILKTYPDHKFIGEETYKGGPFNITDEPTWIVDPIDGTTNFIHGFPMVATSIGLAVGGVPVVGVIYNPFLDQMYSAAKGRGAYLNQKQKLPITGQPLPLKSLGSALICAEFGATREPPAHPARMESFRKLTGHPDQGGVMCHSLRSLGSAAMNISYVASGGTDMYWEISCWPWDVCAGICIVMEAGGAVFGSKHSVLDGEPSADLMAGRRYLLIRGMPPTETESSREVQIRFAKAFYDVVEEWAP